MLASSINFGWKTIGILRLTSNGSVLFGAVRVDENYRALGIEKDGTIVWFFIGCHSDYESKI